MTAYVDDEAVIAGMPLSTAPDPDADPDTEDAARIARITSLCASTAQMIDAENGVDFHRYPTSGSDPVTWVVDGRGSARLHAHYGIISLTTVSVRYSQSADWEPLDDDEWELVSDYQFEDPSRPYDHVNLTRRLPAIRQGVRLAGIRGWAAVPARLAEMNVAWIRQALAAGDSYSGAMQTPDGTFIQTPRLVLPDPVRMFLHRESRRYEACWT